MAKILVNKLGAARRQIDAGIRMLFSNEDPVAIITITSAAFRILRDLAAKSQTSLMHKTLRDMIIPEMQAEFWRVVNGPANFLKHAEKDHDAILDGINEEINDITLFIACNYYQDLGHELTPGMKCFLAWFAATRPKYISSKAPAEIIEMVKDVELSVKELSRQELLALGAHSLRMLKADHYSEI